MTAFSDFEDTIADLARLSLRFRPKPEIQQGIATRLVEDFLALSDVERVEACAIVAQSDVWKKVLALSGYLAEVAVNTGDASLIDTALALHVIEDYRHDYRENMRYLVLIKDAAGRVDTSFQAAVDRVTTFASQGTGRRLAEFRDRDDDLNRLSSVGIKEDNQAGEFRYVPL